MGLFLEDLKVYLSAHGIANISRDTLPEQPDECVGLFIYTHSVPIINDGTGTRYIQIQARNPNPDTAYSTAHVIAGLLDSGIDEEIINLTPERWCIARPRMYPKKLGVDTHGRTTYYYEVALWGDNTQ